MKKKWTCFFIITALVLTLAACGSTEQAPANVDSSEKEVVIRVGYFNTAQYQTQLAIAEKNGYFEEEFEGLNVKLEYYPFAGAGPAINEAFLAGELDVAHGIGDQPAISGIANGNGSKIVSRIVKNTRGIGILVDNDSDIQTIADLKGKRVAVGFGQAGQKCLGLYLADAGLSEADVELVDLSQHDEITAAFEKNEIDAAVGSFLPYTLKGDEEANVCRLLTYFEDHANYAYIEFQSEFIENHPDIVKKFLKALKRANEWYYANVEEGDQIVADFLEIELEDAVLGNASVDIGLGIEEEDIADFKDTYRFLEDNDLLPDEIEDISVIYDDSFIKEVLAE